MGYLRGSNTGYGVTKNYLRGSSNKAWTNGRPPTIHNKVAKLERQVNKLKPTVEDFMFNGTLSTAIGTNVHNIDVTSAIIGDPNFRDRINGDEWYNHRLILNLQSLSNLTRARIIIYSPKRADQNFVPTTSYEFSDFPHKEQHTVYLDTLQSNAYSAQHWVSRAIAKLLSTKTQYDSDSTTVTKSPIKMCIIYRSTSVDVVRYAYKILVQNK